MNRTPSSSPSDRVLTVEYLIELLKKRDYLTADQASQIEQKASTIRSRLHRRKAAKRGEQTAERESVSPLEIVAYFDFEAGDRKLDADLVSQVVADDADLPFRKPDPLDLDMDLISELISQPFARHHSCVPLGRNAQRVTFAVADPYDKQLQFQLRNIVDEDVEIVVSPHPDIQKIITEVYGLNASVLAAEQETDRDLDLGNLEQLVELKSVRNLEATDRPIVNAVEYLLRYAFDQRASDLHIEPKREESTVRLRIDGVLHDIYTLPKQIHRALVSRIKMLGRMDISEKRRPQDGRIKTQRGRNEVELRVATLPVAFGEKVVIRIFDPESAITDLDSIGMTDDELDMWRQFLKHPRGLVLVTGPTGSGKTTTLYSSLQELSDSNQNITTIEDPIEMVQPEFNQVLVQPKIDLTFASALKHVLRQDPDVIMIGEIRDRETATLATQAALTGHLVLSTVHTNDTASTVTRLLDLGVEPFLLASTLVGVVAQRLVRQICQMCKEPTELDRRQLSLLDITLPPRGEQSLPAMHGSGCTKCRDTGYFGRTGVYEFLKVDDNVRRLIRQEAPTETIRKAARAEGMRSLQECAVRKLAKGVTTFEEVAKVYADH